MSREFLNQFQGRNISEEGQKMFAQWRQTFSNEANIIEQLDIENTNLRFETDSRRGNLHAVAKKKQTGLRITRRTCKHCF